MGERMQDTDYVEIAVRRFRKGLEALLTEYRRQGVDARKLLGDPADFARSAFHAIVRPAHDESTCHGFE